MSELFEQHIEQKILPPLAERMRPKSLEHFFGQEHIVGNNGSLRKLIENKEIASMIFWGPPGSGKTTLARIVAQYYEADFVRISAVEAGVKDIRAIIEKAKINQKHEKPTVLFIDEIHRFDKNQQDALLHAVETGLVTLIGATTENPSFEVNSALLSRCNVYHLKELDEIALENILNRAINEDEILKRYNFEFVDKDILFKVSGGDARNLLNIFELIVKSNKNSHTIVIDKQNIEQVINKKIAKYDKKGENHYDTISAFIKSLRGSDPDAAIFWLAKMLDAGEDPKFIARRMVVFASEDIGNADPFALTLAVSVFEAVNLIGMPECRINLAQGATYLASAPKSNASYIAISKALQAIKSGVNLSVPLHLRNAPTRLMKQEGYSLNYKYPHDFENHFIEENYFPDKNTFQVFYYPTEQGREKLIKERLEKLWKKRYNK
ncbi:MAG TPA: replication-associated recombination protein A [Candidatus Kapabacteria bacterium]|jgi:putative ATPase|nr:replication-associated recombination protein A [Candidatus Kapabacteria bacterium]HPP39091.1 replication-associated recombination protein A [Candidatus Kapabacteria bacterium]